MRYTLARIGTDAAGQAIEDVASTQKSVVSILTGIAQDKGLLTISDPVHKYLGVQACSIAVAKQSISSVGQTAEWQHQAGDECARDVIVWSAPRE